MASECPIHYVFSDLDSTLLAPDHRLSELTRSTLKTLSVEKRVPITMATGRIHRDVACVADDLIAYIQGGTNTARESFPGAEIYLITSNGAVVHNALTGELLTEAHLDARIAEEMFRFIPDDEVGINTCIFQHDQWICRRDWPHLNDHCVVSGLRYAHCPSAPPSQTFNADEAKVKTVFDGCFEGISNIFFELASVDLIPQLSKAFDERFGAEASRYSRTFSTNTCMDVMAPGVSKGAALPVVLDQLRAGHGETRDQALAASVAFGDGLNDETMLNAVGRGFVVANANKGLLAACPHLQRIPSNVENGVARTLRELFALDSTA